MLLLNLQGKIWELLWYKNDTNHENVLTELLICIHLRCISALNIWVGYAGLALCLQELSSLKLGLILLPDAHIDTSINWYIEEVAYLNNKER